MASKQQAVSQLGVNCQPFQSAAFFPILRVPFFSPYINCFNEVMKDGLPIQLATGGFQRILPFNRLEDCFNEFELLVLDKNVTGLIEVILFKGELN